MLNLEQIVRDYVRSDEEELALRYAVALSLTLGKIPLDWDNVGNGLWKVLCRIWAARHTSEEEITPETRWIALPELVQIMESIVRETQEQVILDLLAFQTSKLWDRYDIRPIIAKLTEE